MALLIFGLLLFTLVHLVPAAFHSLRASLIGRMGDNPYRGIFSLVVVISLVLIVLGWRSAAPSGVAGVTSRASKAPIPRRRCTS